MVVREPGEVEILKVVKNIYNAKTNGEINFDKWLEQNYLKYSKWKYENNIIEKTNKNNNTSEREETLERILTEGFLKYLTITKE